MGSATAEARSLRLSKTLYSFLKERQSVDFPTCLAPESKTVGEIANAS